MGFFDSLFGGGQTNPADKALPYLNQVPGVMQQYYNPYIQMGQQVMPQYRQQLTNNLQNPAGIMNQIGAGYHASPGYQWQVDQATRAANQAAAAGGMLGTPAEQQQLAGTVTGLANQDYYNYMNNALSQYQNALSGLGGLNQLGYGASTGLANNLASNLMSQANLAYAGQANQNQMQGGLLGDVFGLAGNYLMSPFKLF